MKNKCFHYLCFKVTNYVHIFFFRYAVRQRRNIRRDDCEQPPTYDSAVQEENRIARQNVAHYETSVANDEEDITDDRAILTGP